MKYVSLIAVLAAVCLAACAVEPAPSAEPTVVPTDTTEQAPAAEPTSRLELGAMDEMPCAEVMRFFDAIRLQRDDIGLSTDMEAGNVEMWIEFAVLMSRLHGEVVNFEVARDRVGNCQ